MKGLLRAALCSLLTYSAQSQCPEGAVTAGAFLSVGVFRVNGVSVGTQPVRVGEPLRIQLALLSYAWDPWHDAPMASFSGGQLRVTVNGQAADLTPDGGIETVGFCGAPFVRSKVLNYTPDTAGRLLITARYDNGVAMLWYPMPVRASATALVAVR